MRTKTKGIIWKRARKSHRGKQDPIFKEIKQADLDMLELCAAAGEIDLKYLHESGFCMWSEPSYTYYHRGEQKHLEQTKRRGRRLSIIGLLQPLISFVYGLVIGGVIRSNSCACRTQVLYPDDGARSSRGRKNWTYESNSTG